MNILWITNGLFEHHLTMVGKDPSKVTGGAWLNAAYQSSIGTDGIQLHIVTVSDVSEMIESEHDGNHFYILPRGGNSDDYDIESSANKKAWEEIRQKAQPNIVIVWGTETRFAYLAMKIMRGIPMVIFVQGVMESIFNHYYDGIPDKYKCTTIRDIVNRLNSHSMVNSLMRQVDFEREMFQIASGVIVENDWCEDVCKSINPSLDVYRIQIPIRDVFCSERWSIDSIHRHTIFTNAGGYPIKGHHILFQALGIVKRKYPDVKCHVPGMPLSLFQNYKRRTGYIKLLEDIIRNEGLADNIVYTGVLTSEQMVGYLSTCHAYVMPSVMENHSSSLIEAMLVGTPSIGSLVGGTADYVRHKQNAVLYNSIDAKSLAGNIIRIFEDDKYAVSLSLNALKLREERARDFGEKMLLVYRATN